MTAATKKKDEANYSEETIRDTRHAELDRVYSQRDPSLELNVVKSTDEKKKGERDEVEIVFEDGAYKLEGKALDREGWLRLAKAAARVAQAVA